MENHKTGNNNQLSTIECQFNKPLYRLLCQEEETIPIFSRDWWLDVVCGESLWDVLLIKEKDRIIASLPIYRPLSSVITMPPYTQTMGPWFAPEPDDIKYTSLLGRRQAICKTFIDELPETTFFLQNFDYRITDWLPFYWEGFQQTTRYTYLLEDIRKEEKLWLNMGSNIRRNITKAKEKNQITVKKQIPVDDFIHIHKKTFKRQQLPSPQTDVLKALIQTCYSRGQGELWGGYDEKGQLHAAVCVIWQSNCAWYLAGGGDPALRHSGAHSLVLWEAIKEVASFTQKFDFEGSMIPGVERFFREFGAKQIPFFTISKGKMSLINRIRMKF